MIVQTMATLKGMENAGLIKFAPHTGVKVKGLYGGKDFVIHYVDDTMPGVPSLFTYKGAKYKLTYVSGCFYPYVKFVSKINQ